MDKVFYNQASEKKLDKLENIHLTKAVRLEDAKKKLSKTIASFEEKPNIVSFEYLYTNKQGIYNRIKDKIREAKEVDYTGLIESQN